ncbi:MAG: hypothetical protein IKJ01_09435 [Lachnospiraceae bacterium]|nr:hypothetical protein [Lachnospiraceae bacterium]
MQKMKRILAILGIVLILGVNVLLIFGAGIASENDMGVFHASVVTVILVPVLLWIYLYMYKLMKKREDDKKLEEELEK